MSPTLYTLLSVFICIIPFCIWSFTRYKEALQVISIISMVLIIFLGFILFGLSNTWKSQTQNCEVHEVLKGKHVVVVCTDIKNVILTDYHVDNVLESSKFYWEVNLNHYGLEISRNLKYK